jgi:signal transduction histidine kinase
MASRTRLPTKIAGALGSLGLLALVGYADYLTGYTFSLLVFYLLPIFLGLRYAGTGFAFLLAVLAALTWIFADIAAGHHYEGYLTPIWNTGIRLSIFLLVVILFSNRNHLKKLVEQRTESLRQEIRERSRLQKELMEIAESEQRRIGHDLHDSLGQHLTATALAGKILAKRLASKAAVEPAMAEHLVVMVEEAIDMTRNLAQTLHPIGLGADGLEVGLLNLAASLSTAFNVSCRFQNSGTVVSTDHKVAIHLYRIAQESASNAIRHGRARNIAISLDATSKSLMLAVTDDGTGLPADARTKKGMGLRIMDYRADMIGARFEIQNLPAGGARAVCFLHSSLTDTKEHGDEV